MKDDNDRPASSSRTIGTRITGGVLAAVGFILSPLTWWNDLFVNIPLAYLFAWPFGLIAEALFLPAMVLGYWLSNVVGMVLLHLGVVRTATGRRRRWRENWLNDLVISLLYTAGIVVAVHWGWLKLPAEYFRP